MNEEATDGLAISTLVEWQAPSLTPEQAADVASKTVRRLRNVPGFVEGRFFGDFAAGTHYYLLTWQSQAALDAYSSSEEMLGIREIAAPYVQGRPTRKLLSEYSDRS